VALLLSLSQARELFSKEALREGGDEANFDDEAHSEATAARLTTFYPSNSKIYGGKYPETLDLSCTKK
jgi:hypothetical protein